MRPWIWEIILAAVVLCSVVVILWLVWRAGKRSVGRRHRESLHDRCFGVDFGKGNDRSVVVVMEDEAFMTLRLWLILNGVPDTEIQKATAKIITALDRSAGMVRIDDVMAPVAGDVQALRRKRYFEHAYNLTPGETPGEPQAESERSNHAEATEQSEGRPEAPHDEHAEVGDHGQAD